MRDDVAHGTTTNLDRTIENPVTGEQYTFLATAEETNGELLKVRAEIPASTPGVSLHYRLTFPPPHRGVRGVRGQAGPSRRRGSSRARQRRVGYGAARYRAPLLERWQRTRRLRGRDQAPARKMEQSLRAMVGLARGAKTNDKGVPKNIFELALLYELSESYIVGMPLFLQKGVFRTLARLARRRGYDPEFSWYTKPREA